MNQLGKIAAAMKTSLLQQWKDCGEQLFSICTKRSFIIPFETKHFCPYMSGRKRFS